MKDKLIQEFLNKKNLESELAILEIRYGQTKEQLLKDLTIKMKLMIEEEDLFYKLCKIQKKMESVKRKISNRNTRGEFANRLNRFY